jgi:transposase
MHSREPRRRHGEDLKARVLAACDEPGASVAAVARAHDLNANLVHKWRRGRGAAAADRASPMIDDAATNVGEFIALSLPSPMPASPASPLKVSLPPAAVATSADIRVEVKRGATTVVVTWPTSVAGACAAWLRELVR